VARNHLQEQIARGDKWKWVVKRRERRRQLTALGGLVAKSDLIAPTDDDRVVIFGPLTDAAATLRTERREQALALWQWRGKRRSEQDEIENSDKKEVDFLSRPIQGACQGGAATLAMSSTLPDITTEHLLVARRHA